MQNFSCTKCGSNKLRAEGDHYICEYCDATVFKTASVPRKRLAFIIAALSILLVSAVMLYKLLYSVKSDLREIRTQQTENTQTPYRNQSKPIADPAVASDDNPFSDVILRVKSGYQAQGSENTLNDTLKIYHDLEKNKAFYISLQSDGAYAYGYASGSKSTRVAEAEAMKICESERTERNFTESCIPYAVNDNVSRLLLGW